MQLYLVRHGESANNQTARESGVINGGPNRVPDPPLTDLGVRQARQLGEWWASAPLGTEAPTHVYTSLPLRAIQTAGELAVGLGAQRVTGLVDWFEVGGVWETEPALGGVRVGRPGLTPDEMQARFAWLDVPAGLDPAGWYAPRGHEPRTDAGARAQRAVQGLLARHANNDRVVVVTHGEFSVWALHALLGIAHPPERPDRLPWWILLHNTGVTRVDLSLEPDVDAERAAAGMGVPRASAVAVVHYVNRVDHLPQPELRTH